MLSVRAFAREIAGSLEGNENVTGECHGMTRFLATTPPRAISLLLTGHILERTLDYFFRGRRDLHVIARARLHFVSGNQPVGRKD